MRSGDRANNQGKEERDLQSASLLVEERGGKRGGHRGPRARLGALRGSLRAGSAQFSSRRTKFRAWYAQAYRFRPVRDILYGFLSILVFISRKRDRRNEEDDDTGGELSWLFQAKLRKERQRS